MTLEQWRISKGWTQAEAARQTGFDRPSWNRWELFRRLPSPPIALRIVEITGGAVTLAELFTKPATVESSPSESGGAA